MAASRLLRDMRSSNTGDGGAEKMIDAIPLAFSSALISLGEVFDAHYRVLLPLAIGRAAATFSLIFSHHTRVYLLLFDARPLPKSRRSDG